MIIYCAAGTIFIMALVFLFWLRKRKHVRYKLLHSSIGAVDKMSGEEFEDFLAAHFKKLGYFVSKTSVTNDYGADLVLTRGFEKIVLQAKRYSGKVGIAAVQQIVAATGFYRATKAIVVTNNFFTKNAVALANRNHVELWDRRKLKHVMKRNVQNTREIIKAGTNPSNCPYCGGNLVIRPGKYGAFYGCSNYPKCRFTKKI